MRKTRLFIGVTLVLVAGMLGWSKLASAYSIHTGDNATTPQGQIYDSVYAAGSRVDINSEIFGDVFCAGQNVNVTGIVHGDVICAGQTVHVSGAVDGDVRLAGQTVTLSAVVSGNATIGGQSFVLDSIGSIGGDLTLGSSDSTLNGTIGRDLVVGSGSVFINNVVGRNIKAGVETMNLASGARVGGDIELTSRRDISKDQQAIVTGKITRTEPKGDQSKSKHGAIFGFGIAWFVYWFLAMLFSALILTLIFPRLFQSVTNRARPRPWKALLVGFVAFFAVPVVLVLVGISIIGLPLALIGGLSWLVALLLSGPLFAYYLGRLILHDSSKKTLLIMLVGASALVTLYFIPILGILAWLAATWIGTGMLLLEIFRRTPKHSHATASSASKKIKS